MSFTYNTATNIGKVRAIVGDVTEATAVLSDEQIQVYLDLQSNDLFMSAAMALRAMAASKAIIAKMKSAGNYSEDTRSIASGLLSIAKDLEAAAINTPAEAQVEIILNDFNYNNIIRNKVLRGEPLD